MVFRTISLTLSNQLRYNTHMNRGDSRKRGGSIQTRFERSSL